MVKRTVALFCFGLAATALPLPTRGEDFSTVAARSPGVCNVEVRMVEASGTSAGEGECSVPVNLSDVQNQLSALPFSDYRLVGAQGQDVLMQHEAKFAFSDPDSGMHALTITPQTSGEGKVELQMRWTGRKGETMLETKLRVENGKSVVFGTDKFLAGEKAGSVLCVQVRCP